MSAVNAKAPEPSMDEILASIRRIIADDGEDGGKPAPAAAPQPEAPSADAEPEAAEPAAPSPAASEPLPPLDLPEISFADAPAAPPPAVEPAPPPPDAEPPAAAMTGVEALVSSEATKAIGISFDTLSRTILSQNARTLEDLVKEMLRPMLRAWLDDNLPPMVERLVRTEIERVARSYR